MKNGDKSDPSGLNEVPRSRRQAMRTWWVGVLERDGLAGRVLVGILLAVLAASGAWLLVPEQAALVAPYTEEDLGSFAGGVVKAARDYSIPDQDTTRLKREEARQAVRPVYDHDYLLAERAVRRVRESFATMQRAYEDTRLRSAAARSALARPEPEAGEALKKKGAAPDEAAEPAAADGPPDAADREAGAAAGEAEASAPARPDVEAIAAAFAARKAEFLQVLQVVVDDTEFQALVDDRFSSAVETAIVELVREALAGFVVADLELLAAVRGGSIVVRRVPETTERWERIVDDVDAVIDDVAGVRAQIGERLPEVLPDASPELRLLVGRIARRLVSANLAYNDEETLTRRATAAESVKPVVVQVAKGEKIIGDGERIEARHLLIFQGMREAAAANEAPQAYIGAALLALLMVVSLFVFASGSVWRFRPSRKDLIFLMCALVGTLLATRGGIFLMSALAAQLPAVTEEALLFAIPVAAAPILIRLVLPGEVTLVFAAVLAVFVGVVADGNIGLAAYVITGSAIGADVVRRAKERGAIWRAGTVMGVMNALVAIALSFLAGESSLNQVAAAAIAGVSTLVTVPLTVIGLTSIVERVFGYTTDLKLLELANVNNRLLKELVVAAPGTYQHSMVIGSIVEPAAEAIGANPLLARVGAYYHDIGKGRNPNYFAENQKGDNPHDELTPSMSALIIRRHVSDGIKMAQDAGLPSQIVDMIPMHHGTRLMSYFWHKAKGEAELKDEDPPDENIYRHIGPKPRFREAAILMIADSVEAAARTITEPNRDRFLGLIQKVINGCFADGQFDECDITLKDLHAVARSFAITLEAIYHSRPEYQQPADKSAGPPKAKKPPEKSEKKTNGKGAGKREGEKAAEPAGPAPQREESPRPAAKTPPPTAAAAPAEAATDATEEAPAAADGSEQAPDAAAAEPEEALKRLGSSSR